MGVLRSSYAQFTLADTKALVAKPATVSWEVAGSLASAGGTALTALDRLQVTEGETVLIHAAAGGVGTFAVQLAVARGAKVISTASGRNDERLREFGAVPVTYGEGLRTARSARYDAHRTPSPDHGDHPAQRGDSPATPPPAW
ncbi:hypothetical protein [Streptomyces sp. NPDC050704]|uniref:hypothetical protein n=1 Tax=Streptomyces sp. NPDC050704 TaxID=3157219 RepID=UPI00341238C5